MSPPPRSSPCRALLSFVIAQRLFLVLSPLLLLFSLATASSPSLSPRPPSSWNDVAPGGPGSRLQDGAKNHLLPPRIFEAAVDDHKAAAIESDSDHREWPSPPSFPFPLCRLSPATTLNKPDYDNLKQQTGEDDRSFGGRNDNNTGRVYYVAANGTQVSQPHMCVCVCICVRGGGVFGSLMWRKQATDPNPDPNRNASNHQNGTCESQERPCSLEYAVNNAVSNSTLVLMPGVWLFFFPSLLPLRLTKRRQVFLLKSSLAVANKSLAFESWPDPGGNVTITCTEGQGPAFRFDNSTVIIQDIIFSACSSARLGGGGAIWSDSLSSLSFERAHFVSNSFYAADYSGATVGGGAVRCGGGCGFVACTFWNNTLFYSHSVARAGGGALWIHGDDDLYVVQGAPHPTRCAAGPRINPD